MTREEKHKYYKKLNIADNKRIRNIDFIIESVFIWACMTSWNCTYSKISV